ncbi:MAG: hypothetical protein V7752_10195 [Halopseudomonas sp.]
MLPKPLYEALPYCYFIVGGALWLTSHSLLELLAGALLYFAGAQQWALRSNYRRADRIRNNLINNHPELAKQQLHHDFYPPWLYEMLPFIYIGLGYQLANLLHNPGWSNHLSLDISFTLVASICLIIAGYLILILRGQYRLRARPFQAQRSTPSHSAEEF